MQEKVLFLLRKRMRLSSTKTSGQNRILSSILIKFRNNISVKGIEVKEKFSQTKLRRWHRALGCTVKDAVGLFILRRIIVGIVIVQDATKKGIRIKSVLFEIVEERG